MERRKHFCLEDHMIGESIFCSARSKDFCGSELVENNPCELENHSGTGSKCTWEKMLARRPGLREWLFESTLFSLPYRGHRRDLWEMWVRLTGAAMVRLCSVWLCPTIRPTW